MKLTEDQLRVIIRNFIHESNFKTSGKDYQFTCNFTSNGFIDTAGNWIKLPGSSHHDDWLYPKMRDDVRQGKDIDHYNSWIKVSNSRNITINDYDILKNQIPGLIDMWLTCAKYSPWIFESYSGGEEKFMIFGKIQTETTIEDFLLEHAPELVSYFFNKLSNVL